LLLLARGISVFLEKPLGETAEEAQKIVDAAGERSVGVNQYRRLVPSFAAIKTHIDRGDLGTIKRIMWKEGNKFAWPAQSPFYFRRPWADGKPRGTLLDAGSHIIDLLCWWLGGELDVIDVQSDGYGGPEEFVRAQLGRNGIEIDLTISMHARMPNRYSIEGTKGRIAASVMDFRRITFAKQGSAERSVTLAGSADRADIADRLVSNFVSASLGEEPLLIDAVSVLPSIRTIDAAYRGMRSPLPGYYQEWQP
jgi:predicted dehydrogenase